MTKFEARKLTASQRSYLRKKGKAIPLFKRGPPKGFKQSKDHIAKRTRWGKDHWSWKGDAITDEAGRTRALRQFPKEPCKACGALNAERHHINGNPKDNRPENIRFLCRRCHMKEDGRLERVRKQARRQQPKAVAARRR